MSFQLLILFLFSLIVNLNSRLYLPFRSINWSLKRLIFPIFILLQFSLFNCGINFECSLKKKFFFKLSTFLDVDVPTASLKLARNNESVSIDDPAGFSISGQALEKIKGEAVENRAQART